MKRQNKENELYSINENIYDMFSVEELEKRLQMSALAPWVCGTHDNHPPPDPICNPLFTCGAYEIDPVIE